MLIWFHVCTNGRRGGRGNGSFQSIRRLFMNVWIITAFGACYKLEGRIGINFYEDLVIHFHYVFKKESVAGSAPALHIHSGWFGQGRGQRREGGSRLAVRKMYLSLWTDISYVMHELRSTGDFSPQWFPMIIYLTKARDDISGSFKLLRAQCVNRGNFQLLPKCR